MKLIKKSYNFIRSKTLFCNEEVVTFYHKTPTKIECNATIRRVDTKNIDDALIYESKQRLKVFHNFLREGDLGYYAYLNGSWVHRSWVKTGCSIVSRWGIYHPLELTEDDVYIHYCETSPLARGHSVFPAVLSKIVEDLKVEFSNFYICSLASNIASCKAIQKAGFQIYNRVQVRCFFGIPLYRELEIQSDMIN